MSRAGAWHRPLVAQMAAQLTSGEYSINGLPADIATAADGFARFGHNGAVGRLWLYAEPRLDKMLSHVRLAILNAVQRCHPKEAADAKFRDAVEEYVLPHVDLDVEALGRM